MSRSRSTGNAGGPPAARRQTEAQRRRRREPRAGCSAAATVTAAAAAPPGAGPTVAGPGGNVTSHWQDPGLRGSGPGSESVTVTVFVPAGAAAGQSDRECLRVVQAATHAERAAA